jgi:hypothetical protein
MKREPGGIILLGIDVHIWILVVVVVACILVAGSIVCLCVICSRRKIKRLTEVAAREYQANAVQDVIAQATPSPRKNSKGELEYVELYSDENSPREQLLL